MPTTSMNYSGPARIIVLFIKDSNKDDRLFITPDNETTGYYVTFEQNTILNKTENYVANQELVPYINNLFSAVQVDCDPYDCIQVDFPTYPTIIVERENLLSYLQIFAEQLSSVQAYWPSEISGNDYLPAKPGSREFEGPARLYFIFQKKGKKDDKLSIIPDAHGYKLCYDHADLFHTTERLIYSHELTSYLQLLSASLAFDAEPGVRPKRI